MKINEIKNNIKAQKEASNIIGDGKLPNKYLLCVSNDFCIYNKKENYMQPITEIKKDFKSQFKTIGFFKTFNEALQYIDDNLYIEEEVKTENVNSITIEDRISGQIFNMRVEIYPEKQEFFTTYKTEINTYRDIGFTEKEMQKRGECFK